MVTRPNTKIQYRAPARSGLVTAMSGIAESASLESISSTTSYRRTAVDGVNIFYREAGVSSAPSIVLLHGFPSSSREYAALIPLLATHYHVVAPDFPGFGQSEAPPPSAYAYTFGRLATTTNRFLEQLGIEQYSLYLHDYGGPVGFRMMLLHPERLRALIIQNANAYAEGLGVKWTGIAKYWADRAGHPEIFEAFVSQAATEQRHTSGTSRPERYNPDAWTDEFAFLSRPGQREIQAELLYDYRTNVASYPAWQAWLRAHQPPTLVVWGRNDPSFVAAGALAFKRHLPEAEVHLLDAGHFALDEQNDEIARLVLRFMAKQAPGS
jgi:pimeloyl-ACP methyl ester carboxylesterase